MSEWKNLQIALVEFFLSMPIITNEWQEFSVNMMLDDNEVKLAGPFVGPLKNKEWINAKERLPEKDGRYLVVEKHCTKWVGVCSMRNGEFDMDCTYWMELPEAPK